MIIIEKKLNKININDAHHAWYLCTHYGRQADIIIEKAKDFENDDALERLIRAELWYCIYHEMTNSLTDFFVRRTGRLYFNTPSVKKYKNIILKDTINYLNWDETRIDSEKEKLELRLQDATTYYTEEFK